METILYFVRHADSVFVEGSERTRGLSNQGIRDAQVVRNILKNEQIDELFSSPYERSIETIKLLAIECQKNINLEEDLRERAIGNFAPMAFKEAKHQVFKDMYFSFPGGESSTEAQKRAINVITSIIDSNIGKKILIGTHGDIMTLMLNHFDNRYGYSFWESTSMPDIYKLTIEDNKLIEVERMWGNGER